MPNRSRMKAAPSFSTETAARQRDKPAAPRRAGSAYCPIHHALCYLLPESLAERRKLKEIEALAGAVGGKSGRPARRPPPRFLDRMDRVSRGALRPQCSRIVLNGAGIRGADQ